MLRILASPLLHLLPTLRLHSRFLLPFSERKQHLLTLSKDLLSNHYLYKPSKTVRLMHSVTMARHDPQLAEAVSTGGWREEAAKAEEIIESLSGELHQMAHQEVNMLLQILKEREYRYERTVPIFRALNKQAKLFFGRHLKAAELYRSLVLYKSLAFPKATWLKLLESLLQVSEERSRKEQNLRLSVSQFQKIVILLLQQPFVPLPLTKTAIERLVKEAANSLETLTQLYHISSILPQSLKAKVQYHFARNQVRDILFNPYNQMEEERNPNPNQSKQSNEIKEQLKAKLNEMANEILKLFVASVDAEKLQKSIITSIESEAEPLTKQVIVFASDIVQLKTVVLRYLTENSEKLTPVEFIHLLRKVPGQYVGELLKKYHSGLGKYMSVQEKVYLHLEAHRFFHTPIDPEYIVATIESIENIKYDQFQALTQLISQLPPFSYEKIPQLLSLIKLKIKE